MNHFLIVFILITFPFLSIAQDIPPDQVVTHDDKFSSPSSDSIVSFNTNIDYMQNTFLTVHLFGGNYVKFNKLENAQGPFHVDFQFQQFLSHKNQMLELNMLYSFMDYHTMASHFEEKKNPIILDLIYRQNYKTRSRTMNRDLQFYYSDIVHYLNTPVQEVTKLYNRAGFSYHQYLFDERFDIDTTWLHIENVETYSIFVGTSIFKAGYLEYETKNNYKGKKSWLTDYYFDVIICPKIITNVALKYYDHSISSVIDLERDNINLKDYYLNTYWYGLRIGASFKLRRNFVNIGVGHAFNLKATLYPGVVTHYKTLGGSWCVYF